MQGLLKRLAKIIKRVSTVLALPILIALGTILLINPSQIVEFTTNIANISSIFRILILFVMYVVISGVFYFNGQLPIVDRIRSRNAKKATQQVESTESPQTDKEDKSENKLTAGGILGRTLKAGAKQVANRVLADDEKPKTVATPSEDDEDKATQTLANDDMDEDDFYSFLGTIQQPESAENDSSTAS